MDSKCHSSVTHNFDPVPASRPLCGGNVHKASRLRERIQSRLVATSATPPIWWVHRKRRKLEESLGWNFPLLARTGPSEHREAFLETLLAALCTMKGKHASGIQRDGFKRKHEMLEESERQRLFAALDIWHSCPGQRRHVPAEPGLGTNTFTRVGRG